VQILASVTERLCRQMSLAPRDVPVLPLSAIFIFSTSLSTGDFQPVCIGIILFLEHVGGAEPR